MKTKGTVGEVEHELGNEDVHLKKVVQVQTTWSSMNMGVRRFIF